MMKFFKKIIPFFIINWYHFLMAFLGAILYQFPSRKLKVIGVTGTNGKTTVVEMISKILEEAEYRVASLSSIKFKVGDKEWSNELRMTMPGRLKLQKFLRQAANSNCQYAVLEATSEGLKQHRHKFIDFDIAVITNLTPEHIEAHKGFENYKKTKGKFFEATKNIHIINLDDENAVYFLKIPSKQKLCYNINSHLKIESLKIDWKLKIENWKFIKAANIQTTSQGISFVVENTPFNLHLLGGFNVYNALAAICVGLSQGIDLETCEKALEKIEGIPGRMELVVPEPFNVFVDYAFTPNALEKVYQTISSKPAPYRNEVSGAGFQVPSSKLICVLGACGGGRDKWKRPVLGEIAAKYCDEVIVTNEDPYDENPSQIIKEVMQGVLKIKNQKSKIKNINVNVYDVLDRREAIKKALNLARQGDTVIITGKGCELCICAAGGKRIPWDDRKVVREEFEKTHGKTT